MTAPPCAAIQALPRSSFWLVRTGTLSFQYILHGLHHLNSVHTWAACIGSSIASTA
jgi:hypothetical protein